ncbi:MULTISPECIES: response regulator transcription factor [unclassified Ketobacter]|uniref:response regulator transcription factor n=1 Tax=unclassified Ketobacter TaxID=2639109 RepID=UPI0026B580A0|nr:MULTISPECIES: response regulator transcription factor [unclassified Ketobacter]
MSTTSDIKNACILLVEDHQQLAETTLDFLEGAGFETDYAADGLSALQLAAGNRYDAIVLDVMLPGVDGFTVCQRLRREQGSDVPILMLTARDQLEDKLEGFQMGADDYLVKPFDMPELAARLMAMVRRQRGELAANRLQVADLVLDAGTFEVMRANQVISLSPTCFRILKILMRESPRLVTRESLEQELWGDTPPDSDTLRSHLYKLRQAIDKPFDTALLQTIPGQGFKLAVMR